MCGSTTRNFSIGLLPGNRIRTQDRGRRRGGLRTTVLNRGGGGTGTGGGHTVQRFPERRDSIEAEVVTQAAPSGEAGAESSSRFG